MILVKDLKAKIKELNPNCNPKYLSLMNKSELTIAANGDLEAAVNKHRERIGVKTVQKQHASVVSGAKKQKAIVEDDIKALPTVKKIRKAKAAVSIELKKGVIAIGKGNKAKGQRLLMNARRIAENNKKAAIKISNKKIAGYNKIIKTIDAQAMKQPTSGGSSYGSDL